MTTGAALAVAAGPTFAALVMLGLTDPKRRRTRGETPGPQSRRRVALAVLAICGIVASTAGAPALLIFSVIASVGGWAVASGLSWLNRPASSAINPWLAARGAVLARRLQRHVRTLRALRSRDATQALAQRHLSARLSGSWTGTLAAALLFGVVTCAGASLMTWRAASAVSAEARSLAAMQALTLRRQTEAEVRPALPCLNALVSSLNADQALADILAERSTGLLFRTPSTLDGGDASLQTCLLNHGDDTLEVESTERRWVKRFVLDATSTRVVRSALGTVLTAYEDLAAITSPEEQGDASALPPDVTALLVLMTRNLHRDEVRASADRIPHLYGPKRRASSHPTITA